MEYGEIMETVPAGTEPETLETAPAETIPEETSAETSPEESSVETLPTETEAEAAETLPEETTPEESSGDFSEEMESLEGETIPFYTYAESDELEETEITDTEAIVQAIERQTTEIRNANIVMCAGLGFLIGVCFIKGFRLRRV